jgi:hypothetical protein
MQRERELCLLAANSTYRNQSHRADIDIDLSSNMQVQGRGAWAVFLVVGPGSV